MIRHSNCHSFFKSNRFPANPATILTISYKFKIIFKQKCNFFWSSFSKCKAHIKVFFPTVCWTHSGITPICDLSSIYESPVVQQQGTQSYFCDVIYVCLGAKSPFKLISSQSLLYALHFFFNGMFLKFPVQVMTLLSVDILGLNISLAPKQTLYFYR